MIIKASTLNDILFLFQGEYFSNLSPGQKISYSSKTILKRGVKCLKVFIKDFHFFLFKKSIVRKKSIWVYIVSDNNFRALQSIYNKHLDEIEFIYPKNSYTKYYYEHYCSPLILKWKWIYDLLFPFYLVIYFYSRNRNILLLRHFDLLFEAFTNYYASKHAIKKFKPTAVIFSNDHLPNTRALLKSACTFGIKTIYIQHASISKYFPALEFDLALLEGEDAYRKYKSIGPVKGKVEFIGMPKFDKFAKKLKTSEEIKKIAICYNTLDELEDVKELYFSLRDYFPSIELILRAHPSDRRNLDIDNVIASDAEKELSLEFFQRVDVSISSNSSIHLEAVLLNVPSIYYQFTDWGFFDYYGFVENELVEYADSIESVVKIIDELMKNPTDVQHKAKYYNEVIDTEYYGKSTDLAIEKILNCIGDETSIS